MTRVLRRNLSFIAALAAFALAAKPLGAAIETDPQELYRMMRQAYDAGAAKRWSFGASLSYLSAVLDAGRAYSLFRPTDPEYAALAALTVEVASDLHYDPLTNNDAAQWYVREAAVWVRDHGDAEHAAQASALIGRIDAAQGDPRQLAAQALDDAVANVTTFHDEADARAAVIVTDVRAYNLTRDASFRSRLLHDAADPTAPLGRVPDPENGELFGIVASVLHDPDASESDLAAARAVDERRRHTPGLRATVSERPVPTALRLTYTAPADEYFGDSRISPIVVRDEIIRINKYLDAGWGDRMAPDALHLDSAVEDWQHQYPHDRTLPKYLGRLYALLVRVGAPSTLETAQRVRTMLLVQYPDSNEARTLAAS